MGTTGKNKAQIFINKRIDIFKVNGFKNKNTTQHKINN